MYKVIVSQLGNRNCEAMGGKSLPTDGQCTHIRPGRSRQDGGGEVHGQGDDLHQEDVAGGHSSLVLLRHIRAGNSQICEDDCAKVKYSAR